MTLRRTLIPALGLASLLAACSSNSTESPSGMATQEGEASAAVTQAAPSPQPSAAIATDTPASSASATPAANIIGLEGLGDLRVGEPVPAGSSWKERGAQVSDACRTVSSPEYPSVYAIVSDGKVQRITVGKGSNVKLVEGIGTGASEADVKKWFGGFREEPHKYEAAPAKYLTAPNAKSGDPALRFEIGRDGRVSAMHVGMMPVLGYVEGCA